MPDQTQAEHFAARFIERANLRGSARSLKPAAWPRRRWLEAVCAMAGTAALLRELAAPIAARADLPPQISWLGEVTDWPEAAIPVGETFAPLLETASGKAITTREAWEARRAELKQAWLDFLGPMPAERPPLKLETLSEENSQGVVRKLVRYEAEAGLPVEGYLLAPADGGDQPRPGIVALHQTTDRSIDEVAGLAGPAAMHIGWKLARRGFVVFCPRCFLWQGGNDYLAAVREFQRRHPQAKGMRKMLWDASRAVDVLASLPDLVDPRRIGAAGHSLGAKEVLYLQAFDDRVRAGAASEGGVGFSFTNWNAPWYLGEEIKRPGFPLNHHQILALIAPRPFLVLGGEKGPGAADGVRTAAYYHAAAPAWRLYSPRPALGLDIHGEGHAVSDRSFTRLAEWLEFYLMAKPHGSR